MNKEEFRQWIYDNYNVPGNNCTLAHSMLDGILEWGRCLDEMTQYHFLRTVFPSLPGSILRQVRL